MLWDLSIAWDLRAGLELPRAACFQKLRVAIGVVNLSRQPARFSASHVPNGYGFDGPRRATFASGRYIYGDVSIRF